MAENLTCNICMKTSNKTNDLLLYGEWMIKQNVTVHYFCLLLSKNLPQRGGDSGGILGFLIRDIRREIDEAKRRKCIFCNENGASIACYVCNVYFHLECSIANRCVSEFCGEFRSYCNTCAQDDEYKSNLFANPPKNVQCDICFRPIFTFSRRLVVYGDCCRKGFAHHTCMQNYASSAGYYLRCIWCRSDKFRDSIRLQSVFVPDRDAVWEREKHAFRELLVRHMRCDLPECRCPRGRDYGKATWAILLCELCASSGAHGRCISQSRTPPDSFKCSTCREFEQQIHSQGDAAKRAPVTDANQFSMGNIYVHKEDCKKTSQSLDEVSPVFSDDSTLRHENEITVIPSQKFSGQDPGTNGAEAVDRPNNPRNILDKYFPSPNGSHVFLVFYEFSDKERLNCTGTCTLRCEAADPRLQDLSRSVLEDIDIREEDVWFRDSNRGIYAQVDKYIESLEP